MGYELRMYVVESSSLNPADEEIVLINNNIYPVFSEDDNDDVKYCYPDGNTKKYIDGMPIIHGHYCSIIGMVDLCKISLPHTGICKFEESDGSYMFDPNDGNKLIGLDLYFMYRSFVPLDVVIADFTDELTKNTKGMVPYRRSVIAYELLKSVQNTFRGSTVGCLFYGH